MLILSERLYKKTIKYSIKDWKGVPDEDGEPAKFNLIPFLDYEGKQDGTQIEDGLYKLFIKDLNTTDLSHIYLCIINETELTETDKKKL